MLNTHHWQQLVYACTVSIAHSQAVYLHLQILHVNTYFCDKLNFLELTN